MTTAEMISLLESKGIKLWVEKSQLLYYAPKGALTADLRAQLAERKADIVACLQAQSLRLEFHEFASSPPSLTDPLPLSYAEEGVWLLQQLSPGMTAWNMQTAFHISGVLNVQALERSFNALIERQAILRTAFKLSEGKPVRVISPTLKIQLPVDNFDPLADLGSEIRRIAMDEISRPFDLTMPPLFRVRLLETNEREHGLILVIHHIISDGWSQQVFFRELFSLYERLCSGDSSALPVLPIQYADCAYWMRHSQRANMANDLAYWKAKLEGLPVVEIPFDKKRSERRTFRGATQQRQIPAALAYGLKELCKRERASLFMALVAAFKILLYRYTRATDIAVGSTIAGRSRPEFQNLIGLFINLLVLRSDLSGEPSFRDLLRRVREECLQAYEHQNVPFEKLVEEITAGGGVDGNPFFQVLFNVFNLPAVKYPVNGLTLESIPPRSETAKFDLTVYALEAGGAIEVRFAYSIDLFSNAWVTQILEQYECLLHQIVKDPERPIDDYSLVTPSAKSVLPDPTALLDDTWYGPVHELFARHAQKQPDKVAVRDPHELWTYKQLNDRSNQLAHYLLHYGIGREDIVAIYGHRSVALVWSLLGVLKASAAFCVIDPNHPAARVKEYLHTAKPKALIQIGRAGAAISEVEQILNRFPVRCKVTLLRSDVTEASPPLAQYSMDNPNTRVGADDLAYVIFTSGSTGKPKGVMGRHGPLTHFLPWVAETFELSENDRFSLLAGVSSNIMQREIFTALSLGATLYIPDVEGLGAPGRPDEWMIANQVSAVHLSPAMGQWLDDISQKPITSVRRVFFAGELLKMRDVNRMRRLMPNADVINFYNSSETQRGGGYKVFSRENAIPYKEIPPLGRGVKDVQLLVLNPSGRLAGVGELGEICVRSPHLARGYLGDQELTRNRFITNPFTGMEADRIYRTGEQGRYSTDGELEFVARGQSQISIRGFRIELGEIEAMLEQHPGVRETYIAATEESSGDTRLVAYVVKKNDSGVTVAALRRDLKQKLPSYMIPQAFVILSAMPLTPNGKIDVSALRVPNTSTPPLETAFLLPRTPIEETMVGLWREALNLSAVGVHDDFFDLGGHSLLAMRIISKVNDTLGVGLSMRHLLDAPTVAGLAKIIEALQKTNQNAHELYPEIRSEEDTGEL